jgi:hypothetical protein
LKLFDWFERKVFLGTVLKNYGVLDARPFGIGHLRTSVLLCRQWGQPKLVFRHVGGVASINASARYMAVDATPESLAKLEDVIRDARETISAAAPPA